MDLLYRLLKEFEKEYNIKLCVMINHQIIYGESDNKVIDIDFIKHDKPSKISFNKVVDELSIKYLISVINNIYEAKDEAILLDKLFIGKLNEKEIDDLNEFLNGKKWCLTRMYFDSDDKL